MYINDVLLFIGMVTGTLFLTLTISNIQNLGSDRRYIYSCERKELGLHKEYYKLFKENLMHKIGSMTNPSPYRDCFGAYWRTDYQMTDEYDKTVRYTNFQMNKDWIEKRSKYSLQPLYLSEIWKKMSKTISQPNVIERFVLHCSFMQIQDKKPVLVLNDPFDSVISEPIKGLSVTEANTLVGKLLIVDMEFIKRESKKVKIHAIGTTPFTECGVVEAPLGESIYKKYNFD